VWLSACSWEELGFLIGVVDGAVKPKPSRLTEATFAVLGFESALVEEWCDGYKVGGNYSCAVMLISPERDLLFHDG